MLKSQILGTGSYIPEKSEAVRDFLRRGAPQHLIDRWGVYEHHIIGDNESLIEMEINASLKAIKKAGINVLDIDLIISGTAVPEQIGVPNSNAIQYGIGAKNAAAYDIVQACSSSIPALISAANFISSGQYKYILLTGSSNATRYADPTDAASFVVLGDGAGALIMGPAESNSGILSFDMQSHGEYFNYCGFKFKQTKRDIQLGNTGSKKEEKLYFYIEDVDISSEIVKDFLITSVPITVNNALKKADITIQDMDFFITHQNINTLSGNWVNNLNIPKEKTHLTYSKYGNMTSANIFVNLDEAIQEKKIKTGDIVVFAGQGAGFSVGSIVMRW